MTHLDILRSNIAILQRRADVSAEQMMISLKQLADIVFCRPDISVESAYNELCNAIGKPTAQQRAIICRHVCSAKIFSDELSEMHLFGEGDRALPGTHGRIAYVRNERNDRVFSKLFKRHRGAKSYYVSTFLEACEAVFSNTCEFCLLPIKNNTDGNLYSFYSMLDRYELKICDTEVLEEDSGTKLTEFALIGRRIDTLKTPGAVKRFEFSVIHEDADFLGDLICVAETLGGRIKSVGTQPVPYDDLRGKYYFTMDFDATTPLPVALYLNLEYPRFSPIGLYTVKSKEK